MLHKSALSIYFLEREEVYIAKNYMVLSDGSLIGPKRDKLACVFSKKRGRPSHKEKSIRFHVEEREKDIERGSEGGTCPLSSGLYTT